MQELPDDIDAGIRPLVEELNRAGFRTFSSCQGGFGHSFRYPTVRMYGRGSGGLRRARRQLVSYLASTGRTGYTVSQHYEYDGGTEPVRAFVQLTLASR